LGIFENRVLKRIFEPKREEVAGGWRRLHNEELRNLYPSPNIITVIKSISMRWAEHVARMGKMRNAYKFMVENVKLRDHAEDTCVDGEINYYNGF
jgi:hypothetical protein